MSPAWISNSAPFVQAGGEAVIIWHTQAFRTLAAAHIFCALITLPSLATPAHAWNGRVLRVLSGATFVASWKHQTRIITLYGIASPSPETKPGQKARTFTRTQIKGKRVKINPVTMNSQDRIVAQVFHNGQNLNELLVRSGYAIVDKKQCRATECLDWLRFERNAYERHRGVWADITKIPSHINQHGRTKFYRSQPQ